MTSSFACHSFAVHFNCFSNSSKSEPAFLFFAEPTLEWELGALAVPELGVLALLEVGPLECDSALSN